MTATRQTVYRPVTSRMPAPSRLLQRRCACGTHSALGAECAECHKKKSSLQGQIMVGVSDDSMELEADRVADHLMTAPAHITANGAPRRIRRYSGQASGRLAAAAAPASVDRALANPGRPLEPALLQDMEQLFGRDFSYVRLHSDAAAASSAEEVGAHAFTVGRDIVFARGQYAPRTVSGRRLLAHELTHVAQQNGAAATLQREPDKPATATKQTAASERKDVVLLMADGLEAEAATLAPNATPIHVTSLAQMTAALRGVKQPIGRLFIVAHSLASGDLGFETPKEVKFVRPEQIAKSLSGTLSPANAPEVVDFRGCSVGSDPDAMNTIRAAVGAKSAIGGNCFMVVQENGPVQIDRTNIVNSSQVTGANRKSFESGMRMLIESFGMAKNCVLDASEKSYFRAGGKLVAAWMSPELDTKWDARKSRCYKDLSPENAEVASGQDFDPGLAGNCRLIRVGKQAETR